MKEYNEYMDSITADAGLYSRILEQAVSMHKSAEIRFRKLHIKRAVAIAAIVAVSLSFAVTAYAITRQFVNRADSGSGYVYVVSDQHFVEYPDNSWLDFASGERTHETDGEVWVELYNERYEEVLNVSLDEAFTYLESSFLIPEGFGLAVTDVSIYDDLYLGNKNVSISMESDYGAWSRVTENIVTSYGGANISYNISNINDEEVYHITVGIPGTIEELIINGVTVYRTVVSGEELGLNNYPYNFISMMWQQNGLAFRIFSNDISLTLEDLEALVASVLS